ncbi:Wzz/FepE/Etk N-terminal domain-containing protein [Paludibacter jiangxiensis]|uniref:LPS O-antigen chain length determinant protein, WzzB/FepE family n=1 Tax=Paludibacter jiangxiensis TaxID=681398 RepID=A0A170Z3B9_9BACT|nr:Wzz/FepE/Etk N-terminal domain-containing protein [Paludibacter jiangxiensis]GAT62300.1 LPS O-antigen chain length determinant protein, WzzB/FepE family [Paludibacter jiangxiensis]
MTTPNQSDEISLQEIIQHLTTIKKRVWSKKWIVIAIAVAGAAIGLTTSFLTKPTYTAKLSFALQDEKGGGSLSNLAGLASQFGVNIGGASSAFGGDNLYELFASLRLVEQTLLCPTTINGKTTNLLNLYIDTYELQKKWSKSKKPELQKMAFPLSQDRKTYTRAQDSILQSIYKRIIKKPMLTVAQRSKKLSIGDITFVSENEDLSKLFVENLIRETTDFYVYTKTKVSRDNYMKLLHQADSVKAIFNGAVAARASQADAVPNAVRQVASVGVVRSQSNMQVAGATYAEMIKNLEVMKMTINQETPLVQVIDAPTYPLEKQRLGKAKGILIGGFIGGFLAILWFAALYFWSLFKVSLKEESEKQETEPLT